MKNIYRAALDQLRREIADRQDALDALLNIAEEGPEAPKPPKPKKTATKSRRGSPTRARKKATKGKARRKKSTGRKPWTQEQKDRAAAARAARKAAAAAAPTAENPPAAGPAHGIAARNGTLTGMKLAPAIRAILRKAPRPLTSGEILDRLQAGGYQHTASGPLSNSVTGTLSTMGLLYERRAGRNYYEPLKGGELEGGQA